MPLTSKTYQPNWVLIGPTRSPFLALKTAASRAGSCWPLVTPASLPPFDLDLASIEYFLATDDHDWPESRASLACSALALPLVRTMRRSRLSGVENFDLFLL